MRSKNYNTVFILTLYFVFIMMIIAALAVGSEVFGRLKASMNTNYDLRTSLSYVATKVRQGDAKGAISSGVVDGCDALIISEPIGDTLYETWIYYYEDAIFEIYVENGMVFSPSDGTRLVDLRRFQFELSEGLLTLEAESQDGQTQNLSLAFRT